MVAHVMTFTLIDDVKPGEEKKRRGRRKKSEIEAEQKAKEE